MNTTVALLLLLVFAPSRELGRVAAVLDGDTVVRYVHGERRVCRLYGVDAPEVKLRITRDKEGRVTGRAPRAGGTQPGGPEAWAFVMAFTAGQRLGFTEVGRDLYGRYVVRIDLHGKDLSEALVAAGLAWHYKRYAPHDGRLAALEQEARAAGLGIWAAKEPPTEPAQWRKQH